MKRYFVYILLILILSSCFLTNNVTTDKQINKRFETETNDVKIITIVDKYSRSKKWFYGTIEIYNKTSLTYKFNFNQIVKTNNIEIIPTWNIFPVSYANEVFNLNPNSSRKWIVAWPIIKDKIDFNDIQIIPDTKMTLKDYFIPMIPFTKIDTTKRILKYDSIKYK